MCYKLVGAVIYHRRENASGHYTSYFIDEQQSQWFLADDARVSVHTSLPITPAYTCRLNPSVLQECLRRILSCFFMKYVVIHYK